MPYDDPDAADPELLVGVSLAADEGATREMAAAFAEEFARLGMGCDRILALFRSPHYAGPHRALRLLGEEEVRRIVEENAAFWGRFVCRVEDARPAAAGGPVNAFLRRGGDRKDRAAEGEEAW